MSLTPDQKKKLQKILLSYRHDIGKMTREFKGKINGTVAEMDQVKAKKLKRQIEAS